MVQAVDVFGGFWGSFDAFEGSVFTYAGSLGFGVVSALAYGCGL